MHLLYFGSFVQTLYPYVKTGLKADGLASDEPTFIFMLLRAADVNETIRIDEDSAGYASVAARYKKGSRPISSDIVETFYANHAREQTQQYIKDFIIDTIRRGAKSQLIKDICELISQDTTIDKDVKQELMDEAKPESLASFLTDVLIYSVAVDPTEKEKVLPVEHFHLPPNNDWFTGRNTELQNIEDYFANGGRIQILYGMGGMGKTQLALKYVYDHYRSYSLIHWVDASSIESIVNGYYDFLCAKKITVQKEKDAVVGAYAEYMNSRSDWIIVYDNCDYYKKETFVEFTDICIPSNPTVGHILITTRSNQALGKANRIEIYTLPEKDAIAFLLQRTETNEEDQACRLARRLGFFPLALEIAGAYILATPGCDMNTYCEFLSEDTNLLDDNTDATNYNNTIKEILAFTFERIKKDRNYDPISLAAEYVLQLSSYGASNEINLSAYGCLVSRPDYKVIVESIDEFDDIKDDLIMLSDICNDPLQRNILAKVIVKYALMRTDGKGLLSIHPLQQEISRSNNKMSKLTFAAYLNYSQKDSVLNEKCISALRQTAFVTSFWERSEIQKGAGEKRIITMRLINLLFQIEHTTFRYSILAASSASINEIKDAYEKVKDLLIQAIGVVQKMKPEQISLAWLSIFVHILYTPIGLFTIVNQLKNALELIRFALMTIYTVIAHLGIDSVITADLGDSEDDNEIFPYFIEYLLIDIKECLYYCLVIGEYNERVLPSLNKFPPFFDAYVVAAKWTDEKIIEYRTIIEAFKEKDPFMLPLSYQEKAEKEYHRPFSEIANESMEKLRKTPD